MPAHEFDSVGSAYRSFRASASAFDPTPERTAFYAGALAAFTMILESMAEDQDGSRFEDAAQRITDAFERFGREA